MYLKQILWHSSGKKGVQKCTSGNDHKNVIPDDEATIPNWAVVVVIG